MLGKLFGSDGKPSKKKDKAIVHQSVPEEVLFPNGRKTSESDTSWMDDVFEEKAKAEPSEKAAPLDDVPPTPAYVAPARSAKPAAAAKPVPHAAAQPGAVRVESNDPPLAFPSATPNARTDDRPRFPVGWLVTVEGEGVGNWVPLEEGVSTLGGASDATIPLGKGGAAIAYDPAANVFSISATAAQNVRLNGTPISGPSRLRDGDVIGFEGMALKLVALCSGNFRWSEADKAS